MFIHINIFVTLDSNILKVEIFKNLVIHGIRLVIDFVPFLQKIMVLICNHKEFVEL